MKKAMMTAAVLIAVFGGTPSGIAAAEEASLATCTALYVDPSLPTNPVYTRDCSPWCPYPGPYVGTAGQKVMIAWCALGR